LYSKKGKWIGKCLRCGSCCRQGIYWLWFRNPKEKKEKLEYAIARGCRIVQIGADIIQANFSQKCVNLDEGTTRDTCRLHGKKKPKWCKSFPKGCEKDSIDRLDLNLVVPCGCGFKWVEDEQ
jgi:Fe-S-cluster containining protein